LGIPSLAKKQLEVELDMVVKYFEPGDLVRILDGKYKGETGQVIDIEEGRVSMVLDTTQQEIR
jgi:transcription elongation factor